MEDDFKTSFGEPDDSTFDSSSQQDRHLGSRSSAVQRVSSNAASRQAKWEALGLTKPRAGIVPLSEHPSALESANEALQAARSERRRKEARQSTLSVQNLFKSEARLPEVIGHHVMLCNLGGTALFSS